MGTFKSEIQRPTVPQPPTRLLFIVDKPTQKWFSWLVSSLFSSDFATGLRFLLFVSFYRFLSFPILGFQCHVYYLVIFCPSRQGYLICYLSPKRAAKVDSLYLKPNNFQLTSFSSFPCLLTSKERKN